MEHEDAAIVWGKKESAVTVAHGNDKSCWKAGRSDEASSASKPFNELEDARGGGERNGERCGRRERRSVSVMVKETALRMKGAREEKRREEKRG